MRGLKPAFSGAKRRRALSFFPPLVLIFLVHVFCQAASIRDVRQNVEKIKSIEPPIRFAVLGDSRDGKRVYTKLTQMILAREPHFILHLGDMVNKAGEKEWEEFFEISRAIDIPFFPVIGNHELAGSIRGEEIYRKQFALPEERTYYAFQAGGFLFLVLDSEQEKGRITGEQLSWLSETFSAHRSKPKLAFLHRPLFLPEDSFKIGKAMDRYPSERDDLHQLFVKNGVKAVFQGDDHRYSRMERDRIVYIISGGGGAPLYGPRERGGYFHYVFFSLERGKLEGEVIDLEGRRQDRLRIEWEEKR